MKLSICTDVMGNLSFTDMLDKCVALGVEGVEMTGGGWSKGPHFRADQLLADKGLLKTKLKEIEARGLEIAALNCSANPLDPGPMGERHRKEMEQTIRLAGEIGVKKIVTMSGLPAAAPGDSVPNWLVYTKSWPDEMPERDRYQWEDCAFPLWHRLVKLADEVGVEKYALENFSAMLVWNPETLFRLRNEVGPKVGMNLDPSHLFWKGADPIAGARALATRSTIATARTPASSGGSPTSTACWSSRASMTWPTEPGTTSLSAQVTTCNGGRSSSPSCAWSATTIGSASRWKTSPCRPRRASSRPSTRSRPRSAGKGREEP